MGFPSGNRWRFGGINLDQVTPAGRWAIIELDNTLDMPGVAGNNTRVPLREGRAHVKKYFDERFLTLGMVVYGVNPIELQSIQDTLKQLFGRRNQQLLEQRMPDFSIRQALATVYSTSQRGALGYSSIYPVESGRFTVDFLIPSVFLRSDIQTAPAATLVDASPKNFTITNVGTADDKSSIITMVGPLTNPKLTNNTNGVFVSFTGVLTAGQILIIDTGNYTAAISGANQLDNISHSGDSYFMVLDPDDNLMTIESDVTTTGTVAVSLFPPFQ